MVLFSTVRVPPRVVHHAAANRPSEELPEMVLLVTVRVPP